MKRSVVNSGKRSYEYLSLVEAFRDERGRSRQRTIARLGEVSALRASGDLDRIIAALQRFAADEDPSGGEDDEDDDGPGLCVEADAAPAWGATAVVATIWDQLGLDGFFTGRGRVGFDLGGAVFAMVLNRLTDPSSKRRVRACTCVCVSWGSTTTAAWPGRAGA